MISLRSRVRLVLALAFAACWLAGGGALVAYTSSSQHSVWDSKMQAFADKLMTAIPADKVMEGPFGAGLEVAGDAAPAQDHLRFQVWSNGGKLFIKTQGAPRVPFSALNGHGFSSTVIDGTKWRVYAVTDRTGQVSVQVAVLQSAIDWEMQREALIALSILTLILGGVGFVIEYALWHALRPIALLGTAIMQRQQYDLAPLQHGDLPLEVQPLAAAFNHLLVRLATAVDAERRFIGDAAHELRTPLAALQSQAEVALAAADPARKDAALVKLLAVARRTSRMAEQMLDLARLDAGDHTPRVTAIDASELIKHVAQEYTFRAEQTQRGLVLDTGAGQIVGDIDEIAILLRNLVDNALRFAPAGGCVRVSCGMVAGAGGPRMALAVSDDGPGVPEADRALIFKRFHRIAEGNSGRGSGIGLSLVARIAGLHQATIVTAAGPDGRGLSVQILFP